MQQLVAKSGSGVVTIPKDKLRQEGILEDGEIPDDQSVSVDYVEGGTFIVRFPDGDGQLTDLRECPLIRRVAAELALEMDPKRLGQPAD